MEEREGKIKLQKGTVKWMVFLELTIIALAFFSGFFVHSAFQKEQSDFCLR